MVPDRSIGPVTTTIGMATAIATVLAWLSRTYLNLDIPADIQGAITVIVAYIAGWSVSPKETIEHLETKISLMHMDED